jgi:hypothetical protein
MHEKYLKRMELDAAAPISTSSTYYLPHIRLPKRPNHYTFTLKMATAMFAETLDNFQHSTRLIPEGRSCTIFKTFMFYVHNTHHDGSVYFTLLFLL